MASEKILTTQTSILLAGVIIAAGLFFGLRGREPLPPPASGPAAPTTLSTAPVERSASADTAAPRPPAPAPTPTGPTAADVEKVKQAAATDLERHRQEMTKQCVTAALAKKPDPPGGIKVQFNVTFDAEGRQVGRGLSEDRQTAREGVGACLSQSLPALSVPPPGHPVQVFLDWTLP